jgi:hypothetical protein
MAAAKRSDTGRTAAAAPAGDVDQPAAAPAEDVDRPAAGVAATSPPAAAAPAVPGQGQGRRRPPAPRPPARYVVATRRLTTPTGALAHLPGDLVPTQNVERNGWAGGVRPREE